MNSYLDLMAAGWGSNLSRFFIFIAGCFFDYSFESGGPGSGFGHPCARAKSRSFVRRSSSHRRPTAYIFLSSVFLVLSRIPSTVRRFRSAGASSPSPFSLRASSCDSHSSRVESPDGLAKHTLQRQTTRTEPAFFGRDSLGVLHRALLSPPRPIFSV